jgi:uncharacterized membrane protein (UPF0127 family)
MNKTTTNRILACFLAFLCLTLWIWVPTGSSTPITFRQDKLTIHTSSGDRHFIIEVAVSPEEQERGLMYRKTLARDHGMLFIHTNDEPMYMWMKNTLIPLDMLFIDGRGRVVYIAADAKPESLSIISSGRPARAVLELAGGTAMLDGIKVGDLVIHSYFKP